MNFYYFYNRKISLFNYNLKQIHYISSYVGGMVVNECLKGAGLVLFEIKYSEKLNFSLFTKQLKFSAWAYTMIHSGFFDQKPRNILYKTNLKWK